MIEFRVTFDLETTVIGFTNNGVTIMKFGAAV